MKKYDQRVWGVGFIFTCDGSVIPKATVWSFPTAMAAILVNYVYYDMLELLPWDNTTSITTVWSGFTFVLGFLVVFRSQQAYSRYWEGASLLREIRGEWLNAASSLIAFCSTDRRRRGEVEAYQHLLVRLVSMLHSCALQTVADMDDVTFERFSDQGMERQSIEFLADLEDKRHRCEVITQWIQRHICNGVASGLVPIAPPILSRVYQEISHGVVNLSNARKLTEIPFPFPISQLLQVMLLFYTFVTPAIAGLLMESKFWASLFTFCAVFAFTGVNYIAMEIESPFGNDRNDLPLASMQEEMNDSLWILLEPRAQETPAFHFDKVSHRSYSAIDGSLEANANSPKKGASVSKFQRASSKFSKLRPSRPSVESMSSQRFVNHVNSDSQNDLLDSPDASVNVSTVFGAQYSLDPDFMSDLGGKEGRISHEEEREIMTLPRDEASPRVLAAIHRARGSRITSQRARTPRPPPDTEIESNGFHTKQKDLAYFKAPLLQTSSVEPTQPFSPSPYFPQRIANTLLELPQGTQKMHAIPETSLDESLDQNFTALRTGLTLHVCSIVNLLQQQMRQRENKLQERSLTPPFTPAASARCL